MVILTDEEIKAAREWLADCQFLDIYCESQIFEMDDIQIQNAIKQHFEGGIEGFKNCCACELPEKYDPNFPYPKIYLGRKFNRKVNPIKEYSQTVRQLRKKIIIG